MTLTVHVLRETLHLRLLKTYHLIPVKSSEVAGEEGQGSRT